MNNITWILEKDVFENGDVLLDAAKLQKETIQIWDDEFWQTGCPKIHTEYAIFHASLQNAKRIYDNNLYKPGAFYHNDYYNCSFACANFPEFILNTRCKFTTIRNFLSNPSLIEDVADKNGEFFARPDSALKHFSGRVLSKHGLSKESFDFGFYHDEIDLEIAVSNKLPIEKEWRYICVNSKIVTGSEYIASNRTGVKEAQISPAWEYAQEIASRNIIKDLVYAVDICLSESKYKLLEFNPFSGADLYCCDAALLIKYIKANL